MLSALAIARNRSRETRKYSEQVSDALSTRSSANALVGTINSLRGTEIITHSIKIHGQYEKLFKTPTVVCLKDLIMVRVDSIIYQVRIIRDIEKNLTYSHKKKLKNYFLHLFHCNCILIRN